MTICIAARCLDGYIFCASDRMLTAGDIQYEPPSNKTFLLTRHVVSMMSGDAAFYTEIMDAVLRELGADEAGRVPVNEIAELFVKFRSEAKRKRASAAILGPIGLDSEKFLQRQGDMDPNLVDKLATELINYYVLEVDVIIAGVDERGAQIYTMVDGEVSCNNAIGFASIGSGSRHAESQFMLARHAWNSPLSDTLFLTYSAKKRSEIAPGAGVATDMLMIHPDGPGVTPINDHLLRKLEGVYKALAKKEAKSTELASKEIRRYVDRLAEESEEAAKRQTTVADGEPVPADVPKGKNTRADPKAGQVASREASEKT